MKFCTTCGRKFDDSDVMMCPHDGTPLFGMADSEGDGALSSGVEIDDDVASETKAEAHAPVPEKSVRAHEVYDASGERDDLELGSPIEADEVLNDRGEVDDLFLPPSEASDAQDDAKEDDLFGDLPVSAHVEQDEEIASDSGSYDDLPALVDASSSQEDWDDLPAPSMSGLSSASDVAGDDLPVAVSHDEIAAASDLDAQLGLENRDDIVASALAHQESEEEDALFLPADPIEPEQPEAAEVSIDSSFEGDLLLADDAASLDEASLFEDESILPPQDKEIDEVDSLAAEESAAEALDYEPDISTQDPLPPLETKTPRPPQEEKRSKVGLILFFLLLIAAAGAAWYFLAGPGARVEEPVVPVPSTPAPVVVTPDSAPDAAAEQPDTLMADEVDAGSVDSGADMPDAASDQDAAPEADEVAVEPEPAAPKSQVKPKPKPKPRPRPSRPVVRDPPPVDTPDEPDKKEDAKDVLDNELDSLMN